MLFFWRKTEFCSRNVELFSLGAHSRCSHHISRASVLPTGHSEPVCRYGLCRALGHSPASSESLHSPVAPNAVYGQGPSSSQAVLAVSGILLKPSPDSSGCIISRQANPANISVYRNFPSGFSSSALSMRHFQSSCSHVTSFKPGSNFHGNKLSILVWHISWQGQAAANLLHLHGGVANQRSQG